MWYCAPATGIEPVTSRLTGGRYCQLSYAGSYGTGAAHDPGLGEACTLWTAGPESCLLLHLVAEAGFEPAFAWLMRPAG